MDEKYQEGLINYSKGNIGKALEIWEPLAKAGHLKAQVAHKVASAEKMGEEGNYPVTQMTNALREAILRRIGK